MKQLTSKEFTFLTELLEAEVLAGKKAKIYSNTLTDTTLAERLNSIAHGHGKRCAVLLRLMGGEL